MAIYKIGLGIDIHKYSEESEGSFIMLGGVKIPHNRGIIAHSDGDVLMHALVDAILGTFSSGDIGIHFPPSDEKWKHCDSTVFLKHTMKMLQENGGKLVNIDCVIVCEEPRISSHRERIIKNLSNILNLAENCVSIKGKTSEKLGLIGKGEAIFAEVIVGANFI